MKMLVVEITRMERWRILPWYRRMHSMVCSSKRPMRLLKIVKVKIMVARNTI